MDMCLRALRVVRIVIVLLISCPSLVYTAEKNSTTFTVNSGTDAKKLIANLNDKLKNAANRQIKRLEQGSGDKFRPTKRLVQQQEEARTRIQSKVVPVVTRKVETTVEENKPARMRVIDEEMIGKLSAEELSKVLENLASGLRMLPPLPDQVSSWSKVIAPLLSFDEKTKAKMAQLVGQWFDVLLKNEKDLEKLARISSDSTEEQHPHIAQLRNGYKEYYHNVSQLLYPWVQIALLLDARDPLGIWLQYATNNPQPLKAKLKKLVSVAQNALEKAGNDSATEADARGFILLAIASLFAPEQLFKELGGKVSGAQSDDQ